MERNQVEKTGIKAKSLMVQGTCSNAGKSLIVAGLCRILREEGYRVCPFKAQNMALNSYITEDGKEMGRAQVMQAEACGLKPDVRMNPVLLKPTGDSRSQVIVNGEARWTLEAYKFYEKKPELQKEILKAYNSLAAEYDVIVLEGAGSPAEINLKDEDMVNMGMAKKIRAPVLLVGDIDRGGVFAALAGTMLLFDQEERDLVRGVVINKFRGDPGILQKGIDMLEELIHKPVLGVVPYLSLDLDDEDSLSARLKTEGAKKDAEDALVDIAVLRLPRISNFTDFNALDSIPGVSVRYVDTPRHLGNPDLVFLPGSKNTMGDLAWLKESGFEEPLRARVKRGDPLMGICGGFQMLGKGIEDPLGAEHGGSMEGLGFLPHKTVFSKEKRTVETRGNLSPVGGIFQDLSGLSFEGYEIHMGRSDVDANLTSAGNVYGTYIHGIFDKADIARTLIGALLERKGFRATDLRLQDHRVHVEAEYDKLAKGLRASLDMGEIRRILTEE